MTTPQSHRELECADVVVVVPKLTMTEGCLLLWTTHRRYLRWCRLDFAIVVEEGR